KSTLFAILAGCIEQDKGQILWHQKKKISYLKQITEAGELPNYLSGGEKTKALLTQVFHENAGLLLLDEPTNHLDRAGTAWLIRQVKSFK
ncbi:ATP-binding cassette domain-containing protein, partial [Klebsiella pneumoniae]|uniref:ATP-binding cassette domain-containing protein n=1 Tax=Klebsiella pneumoniae TaxID=573 RepID=UPI00306E653C